MTNEPVTGYPSSPHDDALYEAGRALLVSTLDVGRDFCKFMVGVATGAIPIYLALTGTALGHGFQPTVAQAALLLSPPALFLASAAFFAIGYFPVHGRLSLDIPRQIDEMRDQLITRRYRLATVGFTVLSAGVLVAVGAMTYAISVETSPTNGLPEKSGKTVSAVLE